MSANFERVLALYLLLLNGLVSGLSSFVVKEWLFASWATILVALIIFVCLQALSNLYLGRLSGVFKRASIQLEALQQADFTYQIKPHYRSGEVAKFERELVALSDELHSQKARYNSHIYVIYQLIDKLPCPILVFDEDNKLSYANPAFEAIYHRPWQLDKGRDAEVLELARDNERWQFLNRKLHTSWTLSSSEFYEQGKRYSLLIATDIRKVLRHQELTAWQNLIRVISHEINNTLTPVSSLAQSLQSKVVLPRDQHALSVIEQRCHHLQQFVGRFSELSKPLEVHPKQVVLKDLLMSVNALIAQIYQDQTLLLDCTVRVCQCDPQLLEQVLINLLSNAAEANAKQSPQGKTVSIKAGYQASHVVITITDQGGGFANIENAMTPFYTTKSTGQGIGLTLSRRVIEQHEGSLTVSNGLHGAEVKISLPS
ncbi:MULTISPECIES: sensor histidine kinase [Pseudoalteromonas]|uniref:histidine kinase n=1 Tax=Pseudoalteromonas obscura TaxID=3048491 RepID=A0ABT7ET57_9GAMM|nr:MULTISPECIES: ATP-binding protein [Pseudoalteromonas]MBQ4839707.1 GHKL domain-containing protein [Pseudoalteromonas luteoviolacea]MDK2598213.1 ATP-binding protein [Pseudoalteromonas sp. P94(2023)]